MKKILFVLLAMLVSMPAIMAEELSKSEQKQIDKEVKAKMKEYKKDNWKVLGTASTMENALRKHYTKLAKMGDNGVEVSGIASHCKSKNVGRQMAAQNASVTYANNAKKDVQGRIVVDIAGNGTDAANEFENFYAAYESSVQKEISGEMQESFSIIRDNGDGTFEVQTYFIVNEDDAHKARLRALEKAKTESRAAQMHAEEISKFVRNRISGE